MDIPDPDRFRTALREAIQSQITANNPPETKQTFGRLIVAGFAEEDAWRLLSAVLAFELAAILRESRPFSLAAYVKALNALPDLPLDFQREIVAEIEAERTLVEANRKLVALFEKKIQSKLADIWGESKTSR